MSKKELREQAIAKRRELYAELIQKGAKDSEFCDRLGVGKENISKERKAEAKKLGLEWKPSPRTADLHVPIGLDHRSVSWRTRLGFKLQKLKDIHEPAIVAMMTGLTQAQQRRATISPRTHDWTIGQLQRLADALEVPLDELVKSTITEPTLVNIGFPAK